MTWYENYKGGKRARWRVEGNPVPKASPKFATAEEARAWAIQHGLDTPDVHTIRDLIDEWTKRRKADRNVSQYYLRQVQDDVMRLAAERGWTTIDRITKDEVDRWRMDKDGVGVRQPLRILLSVLRYMQREAGTWMDPRLAGYRLPRQRRRVVAQFLPTSDEVGDILEAAIGWGPHAHGLLHYLSIYGARPSTACVLPISAVDFKAGTLVVQAKTSGQWRHPLLSETLEIFAVCAHGRERTAPLFLKPYMANGCKPPRRVAEVPWHLSKYGEAKQLVEWFQRYFKREFFGPGLKGIYDLKRYAITMMLRAGIDPATVALFTGHLDVKQVLVYLKSDEIAQKAALKRIQSAHALAPLAALGQVASSTDPVSFSAHIQEHTQAHPPSDPKSLLDQDYIPPT